MEAACSCSEAGVNTGYFQGRLSGLTIEDALRLDDDAGTAADDTAW